MVRSSERTEVVCGIDIGSTNLKVVALDRSGLVVARAKQTTPRNRSDLSIDAQGILDAVEDMIIKVCGPDYIVAAVASAGVGEDGVLVDSNRKPLGRALAWFDPRRTRLFEALEPRLPTSEGIGVTTNPSHTIIGWLWSSQQDQNGNASAWAAITDFASCCWSRKSFICDTLAARTAAWDVKTRTWLTDRVEMTLGSSDLLPEVFRTGEPVGLLHSPRLSKAGVLATTAIVVAGGHDHPIGGWGVDQLHPGAILDSMGTAEVVVAQSPIANVLRSSGCDVAPGILSQGSTLLTVTEFARNVQWISQDPAVAAAFGAIVTGSQKPDDYLYSDTFIPGGQGGVRPRYAANAPAAALSRASAAAGALARTGGAAIQAVASRMPTGAPVYVAGGWARSKGWIDIKMAVIGTDVQVIPEPEVTAVGAALLAARAVNWGTPARTALSFGSTTSDLAPLPFSGRR
ncbi:FGGY family carbohydrate kinase [Arthrobacter sp. KNU40]|uniref:FGGY family carbohydrate kinase n=1 Tax=Arthrobacter sp. KNU40 TaxID=3447965 RepID=UPI003F5FF4CB